MLSIHVTVSEEEHTRNSEEYMCPLYVDNSYLPKHASASAPTSVSAHLDSGAEEKLTHNTQCAEGAAEFFLGDPSLSTRNGNVASQHDGHRGQRVLQIPLATNEDVDDCRLYRIALCCCPPWALPI